MAVYETVDPTNKPDEYGRVGVSPDTPVPVGLATKKDAPEAPADKDGSEVDKGGSEAPATKTAPKAPATKTAPKAPAK